MKMSEENKFMRLQKGKMENCSKSDAHGLFQRRKICQAPNVGKNLKIVH